MSATQPIHEHDAEVYNHGSICLVKPRTPAARTWLTENVSESSLWWAGGLVVEPRYLDDLVEAMRGDGLVIA